jgi:hypothetical protein
VSTQKPATLSHLTTKRRGEVAEAAFLVKTASLGFTVAKPWGESDRFDFFVDSGFHCWRVQVKSAHCDGTNGYSFHACGNVQSEVYTAKDIDFLVAYIAPEDVWYVVPVAVFERIKSLKFFPSSRRRMSRFEKFREAWCLMACPNDGECKKEIAVEKRCADGEFTCPNTAL